MKIEYINPFIGSVHKLFSTMLNSRVEQGQIGVAKSNTTPYELTALIGLSGMARGTVAISFPAETAIAMVGRMLGIEVEKFDETVTDGVGEIVNIVAGSAKSKFTGDGPPIDLSLPNVIRGNDYTVEYPSKAVWLEVPFQSELGPFNMRVTFEIDKRGGR
jgi:chemotaxis protein CheX